MSLEEIYTWSGQIAQVFGHLGAWQVLNLALYSLGMMGARHCSPSRVSEQLGVMGKPTTVQRRLERFVDNERIDLRLCCQVWSGWVIGQLVGGWAILLVDETHLGQWLSVMVVGLAYGGCCIPLAWRCYHPHAWPLKQVDLMSLPSSCRFSTSSVFSSATALAPLASRFRIRSLSSWSSLVTESRNSYSRATMRSVRGGSTPMTTLSGASGGLSYEPGAISRYCSPSTPEVFTKNSASWRIVSLTRACTQTFTRT